MGISQGNKMHVPLPEFHPRRAQLRRGSSSPPRVPTPPPQKNLSTLLNTFSVSNQNFPQTNCKLAFACQQDVFSKKIKVVLVKSCISGLTKVETLSYICFTCKWQSGFHPWRIFVLGGLSSRYYDPESLHA